MHTKKSFFRLKTTAALMGVSVVATSLLAFAPLASANVNPLGCLDNDFSIQLNKSVAIAYDETSPNGPTSITYSVSAGNPQNLTGTGCDVDNVTITLTDPHGVAHVLQTGGVYPVGTILGPVGSTVTYSANSADIVDSKLTASASATGSLHDTPIGTDPLNTSKTVSVTVLVPNTTVTLTPSATSTSAGGTVNLMVTEQNTGNAPLSSTTVTLTPPGTILTKTSGSFSGGDTNTNNLLDPGETWAWNVSSTISTTTTFTAVGDGFDALGNHVTLPTYTHEQATATVSIVDARISISPTTGTNEVNHPHSFTGHVDVNSGAGFVSAPSGTVITFGLTGTGTGVLGQTSCTTAGTTGSCDITYTSPTPGVDVATASTSVVVNGVAVIRTTNGLLGNSATAQKAWVDANIGISPATSTNPVGSPHILTGHVNVNTGTGGYVSAPNGTIINFAIASGPGTLSATSCTTASGTGSCTVTLNSTATGTTIINANTSVVVGGVTMSRTTNGLAGNSTSAQKTWRQSLITTTLSSTSVSVNSAVHDSATLAGVTSNATGTVTYNVYAGTSCVGTPVFTNTVNVANGTVPNSSNFTPTSAGTYNWQAVYSGDTQNTSATSVCGTETLTVNGNRPTIATTLSSSTVTMGTLVHDSAILTGASSNATGTVTYNVYAGTSCTGTPVFTSSKNVSNALIPNSDDFATTSVGTYNWQAVYSGDVNNASTTSACGTETLTITGNHPAISTLLSSTSVDVGALVHDSATITGATANATGTVTYNVYAGTSCVGTPVFTNTVNVANGTVPNSSNFTPTSAGTYNWQAVYSGDTQNTSATSVCGTETLVVLKPAVGRMTGGGSIFQADGTRVTHGFELHCDVNSLPNRLEINWGKKPENNFHLTSLTTVSCTNNPSIDPGNPTASFDTYTATGTGTLNNQAGATASWVFTDAGEPGKTDTATITIKNSTGATVLVVSGNLKVGNQQAH